MGLVAGCFDRESQQPLIHSLFLSVEVQLERKGGADDVCAVLCFWGLQAQHRVKQRVERDLQASEQPKARPRRGRVRRYY